MRPHFKSPQTHPATGGFGPSAGGSCTLQFVWSPIYRADWDDDPAAYVEHGLVRWGRSRRLARAVDGHHAFKAYLGVQAFDPSQWHVDRAPEVRFFVSLFHHGRTLVLHTHASMAGALNELYAVHASISAA